MKIRECPHCGGEAYLNANYSCRYKCYFVDVRCVICGSTGHTYKDDEDPEESNWEDDSCEDAVRAWNRRFNEQ